ncbi:hypothetical protein RJ639_030643, partial [Escallonia herrerae]
TLPKHAEIGLGLIGFGVFFSFLGVVLFFDRGLLALSNIFCLAGVALLLGWHSTLRIFTNRANYKITSRALCYILSQAELCYAFCPLPKGLEYLEIFESAHITNVFFGSPLKLRWEVKIEAAPNGSFSFLLGLFFIFVRWPILGIILEIYACVVLFGYESLLLNFLSFSILVLSTLLRCVACSGFWPSVKVFLYQIPVFGWILQYPSME